MRLFVEPMNATVVDIDAAGRIKIEHEGWSAPTLQERRAIIYAAKEEISSLDELLTILDQPDKTA